ncbi:MFS transporter [Sinomonas flava]|uniref:MFS transporter n=1 Tax=Sinomonas flava TaxID=496857 RepID=A0ABN3BT78_9MICC
MAQHTATAPTSPAAGTSLNTPQMRRILASSFVGSAVEYYDFLLYAMAAAVVFNKVFFANLDAGWATFASFGTLAAGYAARPIGGAIFGHFGDRLGRKKMLILSMLMMGLATTAIGLLPTAAAIGVLAPALLVTLRVIQGIAVGGEWGGAMLIALEQAPSGKRGFAASFANMGAPAGAALSTLVMSAMTLLPKAEFLGWGWRVPFLLSAVLVGLALVIRLKVAESPLFQKLEHAAESRRLPIVEVFSRYPRELLLTVLAGVAQFTMAGMVTVWAVSEAVEKGADQTGVLNAKAVAAAAMLATTIVSARMCDRFGRKRILVAGIVAAIAAVFPILWLIGMGTVAGYAVAVILGQAIQGFLFGPLGAFIAEMFPTRVRYTGSSIAYQVSSTIGAGFTPMIAAGIIAATSSTTVLGIAWAAALVVCGVGILLAREGRTRDLASIE